MFGYKRTTRECSVSQVEPRLLAAFLQYFLEHKFGDLKEETLLCCETFSEKENPSKIEALLSGNPDSSDYLGMILTEEWLLWARTEGRSGTKAFGANLKDIKVKQYRSRLTQETGLHIDGYLCDFKEHVWGNLAMGPEEATRKFCEATREAVEKVNPPRKRKIPWFDFLS